MTKKICPLMSRLVTESVTDDQPQVITTRFYDVECLKEKCVFWKLEFNQKTDIIGHNRVSVLKTKIGICACCNNEVEREVVKEILDRKTEQVESTGKMCDCGCSAFHFEVQHNLKPRLNICRAG